MSAWYFCFVCLYSEWRIKDYVLSADDPHGAQSLQFPRQESQPRSRSSILDTRKETARYAGPRYTFGAHRLGSSNFQGEALRLGSHSSFLVTLSFKQIRGFLTDEEADRLIELGHEQLTEEHGDEWRTRQYASNESLFTVKSKITCDVRCLSFDKQPLVCALQRIRNGVLQGARLCLQHPPARHRGSHCPPHHDQARSTAVMARDLAGDWTSIWENCTRGLSRGPHAD
jgi:hypothetical protein